MIVRTAIRRVGCMKVFDYQFIWSRMIAVIAVAVSVVYLTACAGGDMAATSAEQPSSEVAFGVNIADPETVAQWSESYSGVRLDVICPVFDPNIPEDPDQYESLRIWPELRRTEAIRFAVAMKQAIEETNSFGTVSVTPDTAASGDLFVTGKILESNGEDVKIEVQVHDITGKKWMKKTYDHRVKEYHWRDVRKQGEDPYKPVFVRAAEDIEKLLKKKDATQLARLRSISELQFAAAMSPEQFAQHLTIKNEKVELVSLPALDDPDLAAIRAWRIADQSFTRETQSNYLDFVTDTNDSYSVWQEHSMSSVKGEREAREKAALQSIGAVLLILGAAVAADNSSPSAVTNTAITGAALGGMMLMQKSFASNAEGKYHREVLVEAGNDINISIAPQVIQVENETFELRGPIIQQYRDWRQLMKIKYDLGATPSVQL